MFFSFKLISLIIDSIGVIPEPAAKATNFLLLLESIFSNLKLPSGVETSIKSPVFNLLFIKLDIFPFGTFLIATVNFSFDDEQIE